MSVEKDSETSVVLVLALDSCPNDKTIKDEDKEDLDEDVTVTEEEEDKSQNSLEAQEKAPSRWGKKPRSNRTPSGSCCKEPSLLSRVDWAYALLYSVAHIAYISGTTF